MENLILNNERFGMESVTPFFEDVQEKGVACITRFHYKEDILDNLRLIRDAGYMFKMYEGHYTRLSINGELMMSDTGMERISNKNFVKNANGRVLIAGLGIGMIIHNILSKEDVTEVVVIEKYQDVIDLVEPKFAHPKLKVICADIFEWTPPKEEKYDTIYFDIWADISIENLDEIKILSNKFKRKVNRENPKHFMNSWMKEYLQKQKIKDRNDRCGW